MSEPRVYRCSVAARWLPRALAAAVLVGAFLSAYRFDPDGVLTASRYLKVVVVAFGGALAMWVLRKGSEVRTVVSLKTDELIFGYRARKFSLRIDDLDRFEFETPFAQSRTWLAALVLRDRFGQQWRVPAMLDRGDEFVAELTGLSARNDLQAWAETLGLERRMGRFRSRVILGYVAAAAILLLGVIYHFHT